MPELPDLAVFQQNLKTIVLNKIISSSGCNAVKSLINSSPEELDEAVKGNQFTDITRRGKHLIFTLNNDLRLVLHLMLRGRLLLLKSSQTHHTEECIWFDFSDGTMLVVIDPTRWIKLELLKDGDLNNSKLLKNLGPEADKVTLEELKEILQKSRLGRIKPLLMDQKKIAGIGNAYVDEILWKSKIHPNKTASLLTDAQINTLYRNISNVLKWGVEESTKDVGGELAESERSWMNVYRKRGKPCPNCKTPIEQTKVVGRDTFYCRRCQCNQ
ncbi:MAG: DNA-formamidopyrimidine glycosylase family protein [Patescibacteria group bacterium]|nr:hypothetical protein [Patescibacteria group bacterium]